MSDNHGKFCWYELLTSDVAGAKAFYTSLIGWGVEDMPVGDMQYSMWTKPGGGMVGGVSPLPDEAKRMGAPPHWMAHIAVDELDGTVAKARDLGAKVLVPPTPIPNMGAYAVLADPQGAVFGIYKGADEQPVADMDQTMGGISWHELVTSDVEGAKAFYCALFGWKETSSMDMGPEMGAYWMFGHTEKSYGGVMKRPAGASVSAWILYTTVPDTDATLKRIPELGGQVLNGPHEVPGGGRVGVAMDPQGAAFAVYSFGQP